VKVVLTFQVTGTEEEAWAIAEALEQKARDRGYMAANSWVELEPTDRADVLGPEDAAKPPLTSAALLTRREEGAEAASIGGISLGDDDGRSIN